MSTVKQRTNSRVMQQKVEKAQRLLREVEEAIALRGVVHQLWDAAGAHTIIAIENCGKVLDMLEAIREHNRKIEEKRI